MTMTIDSVFYTLLGKSAMRHTTCGMRQIFYIYRFALTHYFLWWR